MRARINRRNLPSAARKYGTRKLKQGYRSHKLKPYREAAKAEKAAFKANVNFQYHKTLHDNPQLTCNPFSRFMQKQQIKRQYAKAGKERRGKSRSGSHQVPNSSKENRRGNDETRRICGETPGGHFDCSCRAASLHYDFRRAVLLRGYVFRQHEQTGGLGTSYTSEDSDLVATENNYAAMENELQSEIDNIESTHPGYDEYRYDLDSIGHNPHELASYLTALLQSYTPQSAQAELERIFSMQYTLTLTEEVEIDATAPKQAPTRKPGKPPPRKSLTSITS